MQGSTQPDDSSPKPLWRRLDAIAGDMNAPLLVVAIGLLALNFGCFMAFRIADALAQIPASTPVHGPAVAGCAAADRPGP